MADDIDNNLPINIDGVNANIGTDVYQNNGITAHAQVVKIAWGDDETVTRATAGTPLPVQVYGITGNTPIITVTGSVRGLGNFEITNTAATPIYVTGGVAAYVYGITGATPVAVTGSVNILSNVGITGIVNVTGGRRLDQSIDSILIGGTAARNWNLTSVDVVRVLGADAGTYVPARIVGASGTDWATIGACGDALKVAIVNTGFSASITFGAVVSVQNNGGDALRIQGTANGTPINVQFPTVPDINIVNSSTPITIDAPAASPNPTNGFIYYGFDRNSNTWQGTNNFEKLLLGKKVSEGSGEGYWHTAGQWLSYIWSSLGEKTSSNYNIITMINEIKGKLFDKVDTRSSIRMSVGSGNHEDIGVNVAKYIDFTITAQYLNGIMYCNAGTENTYEILLISPTVLNNLINENGGFAYNSGSYTYLGTNVINKNTIINGRKPYYLGYRLPINSSVMLPFAFGNAILVSTSNTAVTVTSAQNIVHPLTMIS